MIHHKIYIAGLLIITIIIVLYYYSQEADYRREIEKISALERQQELYERNLELIRSRTIPCPIPNLMTPKSCYLDSELTCTWNEQAKRCDKKEN